MSFHSIVLSASLRQSLYCNNPILFLAPLDFNSKENLERRTAILVCAFISKQEELFRLTVHFKPQAAARPPNLSSNPRKCKPSSFPVPRLQLRLRLTRPLST